MRLNLVDYAYTTRTENFIVSYETVRPIPIIEKEAIWCHSDLSETLVRAKSPIPLIA